MGAMKKQLVNSELFWTRNLFQTTSEGCPPEEESGFDKLTEGLGIRARPMEQHLRARGREPT